MATFFGGIFMISYEPLFKTLEEKNLKPSVLRSKGIIDGKTIAKMRRGESVRLSTIVRICEFLDVPIEKVVEYRRE